MKATFPAKRYSQRNLIETVFSVVKRKLSARAPAHSLPTQAMQALILGLAYNLYKPDASQGFQQSQITSSYLEGRSYHSAE